MHSQIPYITINDEGLCSDCADFIAEQKKEHGLNLDNVQPKYTAKMESVFEKAKLQGRPYDALVLFSGGKDSTYLLYLASKKYGMRVLAFTMVYPTTKPQALENCNSVVTKLGIESMQIRPDEQMYRNYMGYSLVHGDKYGLDENAGCGSCSFIFRWYAMRVAMDFGIPVVLDGRDRAQFGGYLLKDGEELKQEMLSGNKPLEQLHDLFNDAMGEQYRNSIYGYNIEEIKTKHVPTVIAPFTFVDYDIESRSLQIIDELGLDRNKFLSIYTNCDGIYLFDYLMWHKFNCTTYHRSYAHGLRINLPTLSQLKTDRSQQNQEPELSREQIIQVLDEYKDALNYIVDNNITTKNVTPENKDALWQLMPLGIKVYGPQGISIFIERFLSVLEYADYFNLNLKDIVK